MTINDFLALTFLLFLIHNRNRHLNNFIEDFKKYTNSYSLLNQLMN
jgi:hypothetical protein